MPDRYLTTRGAADRYGVPERTLRAAIASGHLAVAVELLGPGGAVTVVGLDPAEVRRWTKNRPSRGPRPKK